MRRWRAGLAVGTVVAATACASAPGPGGAPPQTCVPLAEREGREFGCFVHASEAVGVLGDAPVYWHIRRFADRAQAEAAKGESGIVMEAYGAVWLVSVGPPETGPAAGERIADIGPLVIRPGTAYTAQYMEATFRPGMESIVHRHPGPEAWYNVTGSICLETPDGHQVARAGGSPVIVPEGPPMRLTATGAEIRKSLVLILHDATQPPGTPAPDWEPRNLCRPYVNR